MLDAYTVRKAIPRILLAVIGINLSIYLCVAAIDITNIIGHGLGNLIAGQFVDADSFQSVGVDSNKTNNSIAIGGAMITGLITAGAIFSSAITGAAVAGLAVTGGLALMGVLVPFLITVVLITMAVLFTIIIRQALIIFLTIISPVAIALFVLPGTEKYFKKWLDLFVKTLLVYPIIASIFAVSTAMGAILLGTAGASPGGIGLAKILGAIVVVFAPLVLIPFAFKLAGGAIGAVMNAGGAKAGGLSQRASKGFQEWRKNPNSWAGKQASSAKDDRYASGLSGSQLLSGLTGGVKSIRQGGSFREGYGDSSSALNQERAMLRQKELAQMDANQAVMNNDDALYAGAFMMDNYGNAIGRDGKKIDLANGGKKQYRTQSEMAQFLQAEKGYTPEDARQTAASVTRARATASEKEWDTFAVRQLPHTGTAFETKYANGTTDTDEDGNLLERGAYAGGGTAAFNTALQNATEGDSVSFSNGVAAGRGGFAEARRFDTQPGYGTQMKVSAWQKAGEKPVFETDEWGDQVKDSRGESIPVMDPATGKQKMQKYTAQDAHRDTMENVLLTQGPGALMGGRGNSVRAVSPFLRERVEKAHGKLQKAKAQGGGVPNEEQKARIDKYQREYDETLASTSALHEIASQVSTENGQEFANTVLNAKISGTDQTVFGAIENAESRPGFGAIKKKYGEVYHGQLSDAESRSSVALASKAAADAARQAMREGRMPPGGNITGQNTGWGI